MYEHFYRAYEPDPEKKIEDWEAKRAQAEKEFAAKTLEQRRAEFWDLCKSFHCKEEDIQSQWAEYLRN